MKEQVLDPKSEEEQWTEEQEHLLLDQDLRRVSLAENRYSDSGPIKTALADRFYTVDAVNEDEFEAHITYIGWRTNFEVADEYGDSLSVSSWSQRDVEVDNPSRRKLSRNHASYGALRNNLGMIARIDFKGTGMEEYMTWGETGKDPWDGIFDAWRNDEFFRGLYRHVKNRQDLDSFSDVSYRNPIPVRYDVPDWPQPVDSLLEEFFFQDEDWVKLEVQTPNGAASTKRPFTSSPYRSLYQSQDKWDWLQVLDEASGSVPRGWVERTIEDHDYDRRNNEVFMRVNTGPRIVEFDFEVDMEQNSPAWGLFDETGGFIEDMNDEIVYVRPRGLLSYHNAIADPEDNGAVAVDSLREWDMAIKNPTAFHEKVGKKLGLL